MSINEALKQGYKMAERYSKDAYKEGVKAGAAQAKYERGIRDAVRAQRAEMNAKRLKAAKRAKSEYSKQLKSILNDLREYSAEANKFNTSLAAVEKALLKEFFEGLYLHRRKPENAAKVAETRQFMTEYADEWKKLNPKDRDAAVRTSIDELVNDMDLSRLEEVHGVAKEIYDRGVRRHAEFKATDAGNNCPRR